MRTFVGALAVVVMAMTWPGPPANATGSVTPRQPVPGPTTTTTSGTTTSGTTTSSTTTSTTPTSGTGTSGTSPTPTPTSAPVTTVSVPSAVLGTVPPANPAANCAPSWAQLSTAAGALELIDYCRAQQGVGPLVLPSNFGRLTVPEQMLVIIDLERVNRGEAPVAGLTRPLDRQAQRAAAAGIAPAIGFGDIWEGGPNSTAEADYGWMYDDGYGGTNVDCTTPTSQRCWGHRDIILADNIPGAMVAGAGFKNGLSHGSSYAFGVAGYAPGPRLVFSWAGELRYFQVPPGAEPLGPEHSYQRVPASS